MTRSKKFTSSSLQALYPGSSTLSSWDVAEKKGPLRWKLGCDPPSGQHGEMEGTVNWGFPRCFRFQRTPPAPTLLSWPLPSGFNVSLSHPHSSQPLRVLGESPLTWMDHGKDEQQHPGHVRGCSSWQGDLRSKVWVEKEQPTACGQAFGHQRQVRSFLWHTGLTHHLSRTSAVWDLRHPMHASLRREDAANGSIWVIRRRGQHMVKWPKFFEGEGRAEMTAHTREGG